jgi:hypothetical protein
MFLRIRRGAIAAVATIGLGTLAAPALAHQTFLISDLPVLRPGTDNFLILRNGTYFDSGYSITYQMSRDIAIVQGGKKHKPSREEVGDVDNNPSYKQTYIKVVANPPGTGLAGLAAHPDYIALPAEVFANYLDHEGMTDALKAFKAENKLTTIRERYTKHAKSVFQVGKTLSDDWKTPLGFKVEIFVDRNPSEVKVGEEMPIRVLYEGKPLANQILYVGNASKDPGPKATVPEAAVYTLKTDAEGRAKFKVTSKDKWYVQLIHMQKLANDEDADYESNWSTITFAIL